MNNTDEDLSYDLNILILKSGLGSKAICIAKECGITGGTIILGKGTVKSPILEFLELAENHKEIVLVLSCREKSETFFEKANRHFKLCKNNKGIFFSTPIISILGASNSIGNIENIEEGECDNMYNAIFAIVNRGDAQNVVLAATKAGARGATIINARGSGIHETSKIFSIEIEPEKEIVLILVPCKISDEVCKRIESEIELQTPGKGILFVQNVRKVHGLF